MHVKLKILLSGKLVVFQVFFKPFQEASITNLWVVMIVVMNCSSHRCFNGRKNNFFISGV